MGKVMFDTNVVLDILAKREQLAPAVIAYDVVAMAGDEPILPVSTTTDIAYLMHKHCPSIPVDAVLDSIENLFDIVDVCAVDFRVARASGMTDFEDAVLAAVAEREGARFIITRDKSGFVASRVPPISPADYLVAFMPAGYSYGEVEF